MKGTEELTVNTYQLKDGTFISYYRELGESTCSYCGDTKEESLEGLSTVSGEVIEYLKDKYECLTITEVLQRQLHEELVRGADRKVIEMLKEEKE